MQNGGENVQSNIVIAVFLLVPVQDGREQRAQRGVIVAELQENVQLLASIMAGIIAAAGQKSAGPLGASLEHRMPPLAPSTPASEQAP